MPYLYVFVVPCQYSVLHKNFITKGFFCKKKKKSSLRNVKHVFLRKTMAAAHTTNVKTVFWKTVIAVRGSRSFFQTQ